MVSIVTVFVVHGTMSCFVTRVGRAPLITVPTPTVATAEGTLASSDGPQNITNRSVT